MDVEVWVEGLQRRTQKSSVLRPGWRLHHSSVSSSDTRRCLSGQEKRSYSSLSAPLPTHTHTTLTIGSFPQSVPISVLDTQIISGSFNDIKNKCKKKKSSVDDLLTFEMNIAAVEQSFREIEVGLRLQSFLKKQQQHKSSFHLIKKQQLSLLWIRFGWYVKIFYHESFLYRDIDNYHNIIKVMISSLKAPSCLKFPEDSR